MFIQFITCQKRNVSFSVLSAQLFFCPLVRLALPSAANVADAHSHPLISHTFLNLPFRRHDAVYIPTTLLPSLWTSARGAKLSISMLSQEATTNTADTD